MRNYLNIDRPTAIVNYLWADQDSVQGNEIDRDMDTNAEPVNDPHSWGAPAETLTDED